MRTNRKSASQGDPIDLLEAAMAEHGEGQTELAELLGSKGLASMILNRKRAMSLEVIRKVCGRYNLDANDMIRDYPLVR